MFFFSFLGKKRGEREQSGREEPEKGKEEAFEKGNGYGVRQVYERSVCDQ